MINSIGYKGDKKKKITDYFAISNLVSLVRMPQWRKLKDRTSLGKKLGFGNTEIEELDEVFNEEISAKSSDKGFIWECVGSSYSHSSGQSLKGRP